MTLSGLSGPGSPVNRVSNNKKLAVGARIAPLFIPGRFMKARKPSRRELLRYCTDIGPEDGLEPRNGWHEPQERVANRKALQLCGQVARTLSCVLSGECGDDVLREIIVEAVQPVPNTSRLLVTVTLAPSAAGVEPATVLQHLHSASGMLRSEVAAAIHRRKTPELVFRVVTRGEITP
jgi:ribosome-binding factor A